MISRGIRAYMDREWGTARAAKDAYWAERIARYGPLEGFRIADELRRQALLRDPPIGPAPPPGGRTCLLTCA